MSVSYYERHADKFAKDTLSVDMEELYGPFLARVVQKGLILDAGCGTGRDTREFIRRGYSVEAFDASGRMAELASSVAGIAVEKKAFDELDASNRYDGIWCCASLLHVPAIDFVAVGRRLARAMKPSGVWYLSFKNGSGERNDGERLFVDHTEASLVKAISSIGDVELIEVWITSDRRPGRSSEKWINALAKRSDF